MLRFVVVEILRTAKNYKKYRIDGKSILGLYSLDLSTPVKVEIEGDIDEELKSVINKMIA